MKNYNKILIIIFSFIFSTGILLYSLSAKYIVINPDKTINLTGLQLTILDIYNTFQPLKFKKFNSIPSANQIGEQQIVLYHSTSTNIARMYTITDNTTYYIGLGTIAWVSGSDSDLLDGYDYTYFVTTITAQTITGAKTFTPTTIFSSATFSGNVGIGKTSPAAKVEIKTTADGDRMLQLTNRDDRHLWVQDITVGSDADWSLNNDTGEIIRFLDSDANLRISNRLTVGSNVTPLSFLDVSGNVAVGSYAGVNAAPANGMIISGNVGIGTTSPAEKLDVYNGNIKTNYGVIGTTATFSGSITGSSATFSGNVIIGTTTPTIPLEVWSPSDASAGIRIQRKSASQYLDIGPYWLSSPLSNFSLYVGTGKILQLGSNNVQGQVVVNNGTLISSSATFSGNVGIGTTNPATRLEVIGGDIKCSDDIYTAAWTDYSAVSTIVGWSSFTLKKIFYKKLGKLVFVNFVLAGTSNSATTTFTLPYASNSSLGGVEGLGYTQDNGVAIGAGRFYMSASGSTVYLGKNSIGEGFTASGTKVSVGQFWYESQ